MKRLWIHFTDAQEQRIRTTARKRGVTVSEVVRRSVENDFGLEHEEVKQGRPSRSLDAVLATPDAR